MRTADFLIEGRHLRRDEADNALRRQQRALGADVGIPFGSVAAQMFQRPELRRLADEHEARRNLHRNDPVLRDALGDIADRAAILFVGAGFSIDKDRRGLTGAAIQRDLVGYLRSENPHLEDTWKALDGGTLAVAAQHFERAFGRHVLHDRLTRLMMDEVPPTPLPHHRTLARLGVFRTIITTNWDRLIERAFEDASAGRDHGVRVVRREIDVATIANSAVTLLKLHGDFDPTVGKFETRPVVTELDFRHLATDEPLVFNLLRTFFATHPIIAVGFNPRDPNFESMIEFVYSATDGAANPVYVVNPTNHVEIRGAWPSIRLIQARAEEFVEHIDDFVGSGWGRIGGRFSDADRNVGPRQSWSHRRCLDADAVLKRYPLLRRVEVVSPRPQLHPELRRESAKSLVGTHAAGLLRTYVRPGMRVALSCGTTLNSLVEAATTEWTNFTDVTLYSTTVSCLDDCHAMAPITLISSFARALESIGVRGRAYQLPVTLVPLLADKRLCPFIGTPGDDACGAVPGLTQSIQTYIEEAGRADVFILGLGSLREPSTGFLSLARGCLTSCTTLRTPSLIGNRRQEVLRGPRGIEVTLTEYMARIHDHLGYVGDVMYRMFQRFDPQSRDLHVMSVDSLLSCIEAKPILQRSALFREFLARLLCHVHSVELEVVADASAEATRTVILAASGASKVEAVGAVLDRGVANVLVVDEDLARALARMP